MKIEEKEYRVFDDRNKECSLFIGSYSRALDYVNTIYDSEDFEHTWIEEV